VVGGVVLIKVRCMCMWVLVVSLLGAAFAFPVYSQELPNVDARAAMLIDGNTGQILYQKNADDRLAIASITKVMTLLLTMESLEAGSIRLDDKVTISRAASEMGGSQIWLAAGDVVTVEDLGKAAAVPSANDAAYALAEYVGGFASAFVERMNERARELGMDNTSFQNPTGLDAQGHFSSAKDVSLMALELVKHSKILEWTSSWTIKISTRDQYYANTNKLVNPLTGYKHIDGLKTGSTNNAGASIVATGCLGDVRLIAVVLGASSDDKRYSETVKLLDYGFGVFQPAVLKKSGDVVAVLDVPNGNPDKLELILTEDFRVLVPRGYSDKVELITDITEDLNLPIRQGTTLGEALALVEGKEALRVPLLASTDVDRASVLVVFFRRVRRFVAGIFTAIAGLIR
jgi:D-alanyl-D-alanine carboxypeptidase (penicillin-binding protein 5/6)